MSIRAVKNAFLDAIREDATLAHIVWEGTVKDRPSRYVSVHTDSGVREVGRFTGPQTTSTQTFTVHSVGETPDKAQEVAERVFAQVLDRVLVVPNRACRRVRHGSSQPAQLSDDVSPALYFCVDEFDVTSEPTG